MTERASTWFRRRADQARTAVPGNGAPPGEEPNSPAALRRSIAEMNRYINQNAGRLPGEAVVNARRLTDTLREVIATSEIRPLDVYAELSVRSTLTDYLPTTLHRYLVVATTGISPTGSAATDRPAIAPAAQSLIEQLDALQNSADLVLVAARDQDVDALMTQGNFLRTKFAGSDLDL